MQPDQNPDFNVQEEKPETVSQTVTNETKKTSKKPKKQLAKKEREAIISLLKGGHFLKPRSQSRSLLSQKKLFPR